MIKLRCVVERITYQNPENGYSVMRVKVKGCNDLVTLVGNLLEVPAGSVLLCDGDWKVDKRYGSQFVCRTWEEVMPATIYGIEKYLGSGLVKGIGPKFAQLIVRQFGLDTIEVIETDIRRLYEVPGIGRKRVEKIRESWEKQKDIKNVMLFLQGYGVSTAYAAKIYRQYGKEVFNGDLGYVENVDMEDRTLSVNFDDRLVEYDVSELDELTLAYATTIHKSQGSEYPIVVMPVLMTHYVMLQRNLIYTGITRAKKICVLIGTKKALSLAIRNMSVLKRNTRLKERLTSMH